MALVSELAALMKELSPHLIPKNKLKNLIDLQTAACVVGDDKAYLDEAVAAQVFQQYTGINTNAKTRKTLYDYQQKTGITWPELALCYRRLLTVDGKIRAPIRKDYYRAWIVCLIAILFMILIGVAGWFFISHTNLIALITAYVCVAAAICGIFRVIALLIDLLDALSQISKKHQTSP